MELNSANQENLWELVVAVESNLQQLGLFLAVCDQDLLRTKAIEQYERELVGQGVACHRVSLDKDDPSLYRAVKEGLGQLNLGEQPCMFSVEGAVGLSAKAARNEKSPLEKFLGYLQWTREAMREFEFPIVIWVNGATYNEIARQAPDFYSWRQGVFFFELQQNLVVQTTAPQQVQPIEPEVTDDDLDLSLEELLDYVAQREAKEQYDQNLAKFYQLLAKKYQQEPKTYEQAVATWEKTIALQRKLGLKEDEAGSLIDLGILYYNRSNYRQAMALWEQSLDLAKDIGDRQREAASLGNLGNAYRSLGEYQRAIAFHQQSLEIKREIGNRQGEASSLGSLGSAYYFLGEYERAITFHQQSLDIKREIGDRQGEASSLCGLGLAYESLGEYQRAIAFHQQSLDITREISDRRGEAISLGSLGNAYQSFGEYQRAINFHQQSLDIIREISDRQGEAASLNNLGLAYNNLGEYQRAINFYENALVIQQEIGGKYGLATATYNIAFSWAKLGRKFEAQQNILAAKALYKEMGVEHMVERCEEQRRDILKIVDASTVQPLWTPDAPTPRQNVLLHSAFSEPPDDITEKPQALPPAFQIPAPKPRRSLLHTLWLRFRRFIRKLFGG